MAHATHATVIPKGMAVYQNLPSFALNVGRKDEASSNS